MSKELNKPLKFEVICDYEDILKKAISLYNQTYRTEFVFTAMIFEDIYCVNLDLSSLEAKFTILKNCKLDNSDFIYVNTSGTAISDNNETNVRWK